MKAAYTGSTISEWCRRLGYSKQAWYKRKSGPLKADRRSDVLAVIQKVRHMLPLCGMRKIHHLAADYNCYAGRDAFFTVARSHGLLIKPRKRYQKTTDNSHWMRQHPNLLKGMEVCAPDQVWVADITYLGGAKELYLHLLTDAYSKKIVGWHVCEDLSSASSIKALEMAIQQRAYQGPLIHHSDRGLQYLSRPYGLKLKSAGICSSCTQDSSPYDNAVAERINGILKQEFDIERKWESLRQAENEIRQAVYLYNNVRPHYSNNYLTPAQMHAQQRQKIKTYRSSASLKTQTLQPKH